MSDDFEKAVLFSFDQSGSVNPALKERAQAYCNEVRAAPNCWRLCAERFSTTGYMEVKFWCLQTLHQCLRERYQSLSAQERMMIKQVLMSWVRSIGAANLQAEVPAFIKNKVAQILVYIVQVEYPDEWPTFFSDLVLLLGEGTGLADMFCRILAAIDEDIISLEISRSQEEVQRSMQLKDAMRDRCLTKIAEAWYMLLSAYHASEPDLAAFVLDTMQRYINWIDIGLVANDKFVPLLFSLVSRPYENLQAAATDVLTEVVNKRMEAVLKLTLIQRLNIAPVCAQWSQGFPVGENDPILASKYARLLAALATELLEAWKKVENQLVSLAAVGLAVGVEAAAEGGAACDTAQQLLNELFPAVLATLRRDDEVAALVVPFLQAYVAKLKTTLKRSGGALPPSQAQHIPGILDSLALAARYPEDSVAYEGAPPSEADAVAAAEEDAEVAEKRGDLFVLFRNTAKVAPAAAYQFVAARLQSVMAQNSASFQEVEATVQLLYQLGEGAPDDALKPGTGVLAQLATGLMQAQLPAANHRLVALAVMECHVRYVRVLAQQPQCIPPVLRTFLGDHGMGHPCEAVATRACYLFCRLVKAVRSSLRQALPGILQSIGPHLSRIATQPQPDAAATVNKAAAATKGPPGVSSAVDDRLYAYEAVGLLLGQEELSPPELAAYTQALLQPLLQQIETNLASATGNGAANGAAVHTHPGTAISRVQQALEAVTRLSKGYSLALVRARPEVGNLFVGALEVALRVPQALPGSKPLRARFISLLHRMVESLGSAVLPYLPTALEVLMHAGADADDLADVLALLSQLAVRFKSALCELLQKALPVCVSRVHAMLTSDWDWSGRSALPQNPATPSAAAATAPAATGSTEDAREKEALQRAFYSFLHSVTHYELAGALLGAQAGTLDAVSGDLARGASVHVDPGVRRTCLQVLRRLVIETPAEVRGFHSLAVEAAVKALQGGLDLRDVVTNNLLKDAAELLQDEYKKCGDDLVAFALGAAAQPAVREQLLSVLRQQQQQQQQGAGGGDGKALRECLKGIMRELNGAAAPEQRRASLAG